MNPQKVTSHNNNNNNIESWWWYEEPKGMYVCHYLNGRSSYSLISWKKIESSLKRYKSSLNLK